MVEISPPANANKMQNDKNNNDAVTWNTEIVQNARHRCETLLNKRTNEEKKLYLHILTGILPKCFYRTIFVSVS